MGTSVKAYINANYSRYTNARTSGMVHSRTQAQRFLAARGYHRSEAQASSFDSQVATEVKKLRLSGYVKSLAVVQLG